MERERRQGHLVLEAIQPTAWGEGYRFAATLVDCMAPPAGGCPYGHPGEARLQLHVDAATLHSYSRFQRAVLARFGRLLWDVRGENGPHAWREALRVLVPS